MTEIIKQPAKIHTVYNPVVFRLKKEAEETEESPTLEIIKDDERIKLDIRYDNQGCASVNIMEFLKSFFKKIDNSSSPVVVDEFQSFQYQLKQGDTVLGHYTAVKSVAQIRETQDLTVQHDKLLTGFKRLIAYIDNGVKYPADVSIIASGGAWKNEELTANKVNRLAYDCEDYEIKIDSFVCTLEWSDFVCLQVDTVGIAPPKSGYAAAKTLTIKNYINNVEVESKSYNILTDVEPEWYDFLFVMKTPDEIQARAEQLINSIAVCQNPTHINEPIKQDYNLCPYQAYIFINKRTYETLSFDACNPVATQINISASDAWSIQGVVPPWLTLSQTSGNAGNTVISISAEAGTDVDRSVSLAFQLPNLQQATLYIEQQACVQIPNVLRLNFEFMSGITVAKIRIDAVEPPYVISPNNNSIDVPISSTPQAVNIQFVSYSIEIGDELVGGWMHVEPSNNVSVSQQCNTVTELTVNNLNQQAIANIRLWKFEDTCS